MQCNLIGNVAPLCGAIGERWHEIPQLRTPTVRLQWPTALSTAMAAFAYGFANHMLVRVYRIAAHVRFIGLPSIT